MDPVQRSTNYCYVAPENEYPKKYRYGKHNLQFCSRTAHELWLSIKGLEATESATTPKNAPTAPQNVNLEPQLSLFSRLAACPFASRKEVPPDEPKYYDGITEVRLDEIEDEFPDTFTWKGYGVPPK